MRPLYNQVQFEIAKSKDKLECECYTCSKPFLVSKNTIKFVLKSGSGKGKYCSKNCQNKSQITKQKVECKNCGVEVDKNLSDIRKTLNSFCSLSCSSTFNNTLKNHNTYKNANLTICTKCGEETSKRRKYCDKCFDSLSIKEDKVSIEDVIYKKHHKSASFSYIRDRAKSKLAKNRVLRCEVCGYDNHVECAHIKSISSFEKTVKLSEVNNIENLLWLCPNHHWELDFGDLTLEDIIKSKFYHKKC